jgi:hypothetical protein
MKVFAELSELEHLRGAIVVSAGGHLEQAMRRAKQFGLKKNVIFIIPKNAQSESKLKEQERIYIRNVGSRDIISLIYAAISLLRILNKREFDYVLSTGAGIALACCFVCKIKRINFYYIESIARNKNPSLTGKILALTKSTIRYSESPFFDDRKWNRIETLFAMYKTSAKTDLSSVTRPLKIFVTVGTVHQYRFERLIQLVKSIVNENDQVIWQIGEINSMDVIGECHREITEDKFSQLVDWADVVITHSGVGSILTSLDRGKYPIVVPRLSKYGEHVDDHQLEIASVISNLELGSIVLDSMDREVLYKSLSSQIVVREKGGL